MTNHTQNGVGVKRSLRRPDDTRMLGGVAGGIAQFFDVDVLYVRIGLVALAFSVEVASCSMSPHGHLFRGGLRHFNRPKNPFGVLAGKHRDRERSIALSLCSSVPLFK